MMSGRQSDQLEKEKTSASPFSGSYFDGVDGFEAKLWIKEFKQDTIRVSLVSDCETPKKWTVVVKAEQQQQMPNISCDGYSYTGEWKFLLSQLIDPNTFEYSCCDGFLILKARNKVVEETPNKGKKRKVINTEFSDQNVKRFRRDSGDSGLDEEIVASDDEPEEVLLPVEMIRHILSFISSPNELRQLALVNSKWAEAVSQLRLPATLNINDSFLRPTKYLDFIETFQHHRTLPFTAVNYVFKKKPNISQHTVLDFIAERAAHVEFLNVILQFEQHNGHQSSFLLDWVSNIKSCKRLKMRINGYNKGIPIYYGNFDLSHVKELDLSALIYQQMQEDLKCIFPLNKCNYRIYHSKCK